jgi:putative flippase GtrA
VPLVAGGDAPFEGSVGRPRWVQSAIVPALGSTLRRTWLILLKELSAFGVVGAVCFVLDLAVFQLLYAELGVGAVTAKLGAAAVSTTGAFLGHRFWSFSHRVHARPGRQSLVFALINGATLALGAAVIWLVRYPLGQENVLVVQLANLATIALGTVIRYLGYRRWVFTEPVAVADQVADAAPDVPAVA